MNLRELAEKYYEYKGEPFDKNGNQYADMRKKMLRAFEILGILDPSVFKDNNDDYNFPEENVQFLFDLLDNETSPLFKRIRKGEMLETDYIEYADKIEDMLLFLKSFLDEEKYNLAYKQICENTRFPLLKLYQEKLIYFKNIYDYVQCIIFDKQNRMSDEDESEDEDGQIEIHSNKYIDIGDLTGNDKIALFEELVKSLREWKKLVDNFQQYRVDEWNEHADKETTKNPPPITLLFDVVDVAIHEEYKSKATLFVPISKARNYNAQERIFDRVDKANRNLKLHLSKKYCQEHGLDFIKYKKQEKAHYDYWESVSRKFKPIPTEEVLEELKESKE